MDMYYGMRLSTAGASSAAYMYVTLVSDGDFDGAAVTLHPTAANTTWFSYQDKSVQMQLPALASLSAGITVVTGAQNIAGTLGVSPAIDVDTVLILYGTSALGEVTLPAGQTSVPFDFPVQPDRALSGANAAGTFLTDAEPKP
ncbi:MAG TPA: hypothetical protein VGF28_12185 [Thermoanaerobaculia bacterium]|jgi:hypothetical protein